MSWGHAPAYELPRWPFVAPPDIGAARRARWPVVIVGAGLAGLTLANDLAQRGVPALLLDDDDTVGVRGASSRGICYAQKSLEIFARLGIAERIRFRGVTWSVGRTFSGSDLVYAFNLQARNVSEQPPFVNIQQFLVEWFLVDRLLERPGRVALRWKNRVAGIEPQADAVVVHVETPAGGYAVEAGHVVDASGANSALRDQLGLDAHPARSADRWCISDVRFAKALPAERWTWTDAPFNEGRAVWQHPMADGVWRMDYQMAPDADPAAVSRPEVVAARLAQQLGPGVDFEFVWIGPYQYRDHLLDSFRHGRVFFVGDSAHVVSPFGARGGNSGIQDAANLGWKLALAAAGRAGDALLDSYDAERRAAAAENLRVTSRTARFLAPRSAAERSLRGAVMGLARDHAFARPLVDAGRMSVANDYPGGVRSLPDIAFDGSSVGALLRDAPDFAGLWFGSGPAPAATIPVRTVDPDGALAAHLAHLGVAAGSFVLLRPDAYIGAVIADATPAAIAAALADCVSSGTCRGSAAPG